MATKPTKATKAIQIKRSAVPVTLRILLGQLVTIGLILVSFFIFLPIPGIGWIIFLITSVLSLILNLLLSLGFYYDWKGRNKEKEY